MRRLAVMVFLVAARLSGQDEGNGSLEAAKLEWSGNLDAKYTLLRLSPGSALGRLQFFQQTIPATASQYRLEPYLNASYATREVGFQLRLHGTYYDDRRSTLDLFEAIARYSPSLHLSLQAGKSVYNWGKGYAFNPVGFVNPAKDPENPELAQAGLVSAHAEYLTTFESGPLRSISALVVVIPPAPTLNDRFGDVEQTEIAVKLSALVWDADIDLMIHQRPRQSDQYGIDLATNLLDNLELHSEFAWTPEYRRASIQNGSVLQAKATAVDLLAGLRFLSASNITVIAEYYRSGGGMDEAEFGAYRAFLLNGATVGTPAAVQQALQASQTYFRSTTLMRDYVYLKASQPEPFDWLYLTPSMFALVNVNDGSFLLSAPVSYKPATNVEFILWPSVLVGDETKEFGSRQARQRIEFWMRAFF